jgi:hypothetical protein
MIAAAADRLLRSDAGGAPTRPQCVVLGIGGAALVGAALGSSSGEPLLALYAAIKVPLLLVLTTALCLPSFFVINTVLGLRDDFAAACRALLIAQAGLGVALAAFAPAAVFTGQSILDPYGQTLVDAVLFAMATSVGHRILTRHYEPLVARDPRHRLALRGWLVLYAFAAAQLAWVLRPFRGTEGFAVQFLRPEAFEQNAYVVLLEHVERLLR